MLHRCLAILLPDLILGDYLVNAESSDLIGREQICVASERSLLAATSAQMLRLAELAAMSPSIFCRCRLRHSRNVLLLFHLCRKIRIFIATIADQI